MPKLTMIPNMIPSVTRIHRRIRRLNAAYMEADDKRETVAVLQAHVSELAVAHSLLPSDLLGAVSRAPLCVTKAPNVRRDARYVSLTARRHGRPCVHSTGHPVPSRQGGGGKGTV